MWEDTSGGNPNGKIVLVGCFFHGEAVHVEE